MSLPKLLLIFVVLLFGGIFTAAAFKKGRSNNTQLVDQVHQGSQSSQSGQINQSAQAPITVATLDTIEIEIPVEIDASKTTKSQRNTETNHKSSPAATSQKNSQAATSQKSSPTATSQKNSFAIKSSKDTPSNSLINLEESIVSEADLPEANRIDEFFNKREPRFPIVQTISYKSHVPWQQGRPAWIADYSSHYKTSRHFIARSLNGKPDYEKQDVAEGVRFNVFNEEKKVEFYLVIDVLLNKMWFYYVDKDTAEPVLVKTYKVGLGRPDDQSPSGLLTPLGKYVLGDKIAVYKPKMTGNHQGEKIEMVRTFGTRWIPFGEEIGECTASAKGFGIHGLPLAPNENGEYIEASESIGKYESDGCIRMATKDVEELFSVIITKPTTVELVRGFKNASFVKEHKL